MSKGIKPELKLAKAAAGLVAHIVAPAATTAFSLLKKGPDALADYIEQRTQRRYEEFCRSAYEGTVFPENGENLTTDELMTMLRGCLADLEDQKSILYGRLASAIATGTVPSPYKHPLMVTLVALTFAQMERLRRAWVTGRYELIPRIGAGSQQPSEVFKGDGLMDEWDTATLAGHSMIKDGSLTKLGEHLVTACYTKGERTPGAIGEREWIRGGKLPIVSYEMESKAVLSAASAIESAARNHGMKCTPLAAPPDQNHADTLWFNMFPSVVIVVDRDGSRLIEKLHLFKQPLSRGVRPIVVFTKERNTAVMRAIPDAVAIEMAVAGDLYTELVMDQVLEVVRENKNRASITPDHV
jgi:hypothetical protein